MTRSKRTNPQQFAQDRRDLGRSAQARRRSRRACGHHGGVQISARGDYAVRAALELANAYPATISAQALADAQGLPRKFLEAVLADLRRSGVIHAVRGADGGYSLSSPPAEVTIGMVLRAVDGPLAGVRGHRPEQTSYAGTSDPPAAGMGRRALRGARRRRRGDPRPGRHRAAARGRPRSDRRSRTPGSRADLRDRR